MYFGDDEVRVYFADKSTHFHSPLGICQALPSTCALSHVIPKTKGAIKLHALLDLHGKILTFLHISDGKLHDVNVMNYLPPEAGAFYITDRAYLDFDHLYRIHLCEIYLS